MSVLITFDEEMRRYMAARFVAGCQVKVLPVVSDIVIITSRKYCSWHSYLQRVTMQSAVLAIT